MTKLHEILAVEKTVVSAANKMLADTATKFGKFDYFQGHSKILRMIEDSPQNAAIEASAAENKQMATTVAETLEYALKFWADAEDVIFQKNRTNQYAIADVMLNGTVLLQDAPVDELMGLEVRLTALRKVFEQMPTLDASRGWVQDSSSGRKGAWTVSTPDITTKTEKSTTAVVLYDATDKHPAQIKEVPSDKTVGTFTLTKTCGAATSAQKAEVLSTVDNLLIEVKQARMRANSVDVKQAQIGKALVELILKPFKE